MRFSAHLRKIDMHKNAVPPSNLSSPDLSGASAPSSVPASEGVNRREFIKRTGLAVAGATAASAFIGPRRVWAAGPVEITFASAKFFGKETIAEVVNAYNGSQSKIH